MKTKTVLFVLLAAMGTVSILHAQIVTPAQEQYLKRQPVVTATVVTNTVGDLASADWAPVVDAIKGKKLILLGEFNHGSREVFLLRNDLIRHLHETIGAEVVLFESGVGEVGAVDLYKSQLKDEELAEGFFGGWRTSEFRELMGYIQRENIAAAGFDVQRTGGSFLPLLTKVAWEAGADTLLCRRLEEEYGMLHRSLGQRNAVYDTLVLSANKLIGEYGVLREQISEKQPEARSKATLLTIKTIDNRIRYLRYMLRFVKDQNWHGRWAARDSAMADNILWLSEKMFPGKTMVVVAHNYHIARHNDDEVTMGELLAARFGSDMYTLGVFAGSGSFANNGGVVETMAPPDPQATDIKNFIAHISGFASFLPIPPQPLEGGEWLFETLVVNDTFIDLNGSNQMVLSKHFDGLLFLKEVTPPAK